MNYQTLRNIKSLYFSYNEVADLLGLKPDSARVFCSRYVSKGLLIRIKRNIYVLRERWDYLNDLEVMQIANIIQVPSYVSLTTALSFYGHTTQLQQDYIESISVQRSYNTTVVKSEFNFTKISGQYYSDFIRQDGVFISTPEKALVDALYLTSLGRYSLDFSALDVSKFDLVRVTQILDSYPDRVKKLWKKYETS
jgi:predicted transcriptional regulator of viral defense system